MLGSPASATSLLVTTACLLSNTLTLSTPEDTSSAPSPPVFSLVPTTQTQLYINDKNTARIIRRNQYYFLATSANGALREVLLGKSSPAVAPPTSNSLPKQTVHTQCHELTVWQALRQNRTQKHNPMAKSTSAALCAHEN